MLSKQARRSLKIYKTVLELEKLAQQYNLPGLSQEPIDNTSIEKEDETKRYDLSALDLSSLKPDLHSGISTNDIRKIILHELKANPEFPKQTVIDAVIGDAREDLRSLITEHLSHMPELRAKLPVDTKQQTLPNTPPEIKILPTQEDIEETKRRLDKEKETAIKEYDAKKTIVVEKYKAENEGKEPDEWTLRKLMDYKDDPRGGSTYGYKGISGGEDIKLDLGNITQGQYDGSLKKLYRLYYSIEKNYAELDAIRGRITEINIPDELPAKDPSTFKSYKEMVYDLRDRTLVGLQNIVANSIGYTLFGAASGRHSDSTSIFDQQEAQWFENPAKMKEFLEMVPKVYDARDRFWSSYGYNANDIQFWFEQKSKRLSDYDDSLRRTKESFAKGVRFLNMMNTKLAANLDAALDASVFQYSEYIETTPEHKAKLDALYLEIVERIQDTSKVATRTSSYYNNGMYANRTPHGYGSGIDDVDLSKMMSAKKTTQADMLNSLTKLLLSSIKTVAIQINENELGPLIKEISKDLMKLYIEERVGVKMEELPTKAGGTDYYSRDRGLGIKAVYGDPRAIKVVDAWFAYAANSKLSTNFQSIVKYPEFIFKGDKETAEFVIAGMKEKLGYRITQVLVENLPDKSRQLVIELVNQPAFVYRGPEETRKWVFAQKDEMFRQFQQDIDKAALADGSFNLTGIDHDAGVSGRAEATSPRFDKVKAIFKSSIERMIADKDMPGRDRMLGRISSILPGGYLSDADIANKMDSIVNAIVGTSLAPGSTSAGILNDFLKDDAIGPLRMNLRNRKRVADNDPITIDLLSADFFVSRQILDSVVINPINEPAEIDKMRDLKLPTDFSSLKMDVLVQYSNHLRQLFNTAMPEKEIIERVKGIIKQQEELNKDFNAKLETAIAKLKYRLELNKKIKDEQELSYIFSTRLRTFGGVGPYTIDAKFKQLGSDPRLAHLPLQQLGKITNEETMTGFRSEKPSLESRLAKNVDKASWTYDQFTGDGYGTKAGIATAVIAKTLDIKDANQIYKLLETCNNALMDVNISKEEIEYIFPAMITNKDALTSQLETAKALAEFAHSEGSGLSKDVILSFAKNPNFKDWVKEVDAIENFFDAYIKIKREGGARKFYANNKATFKALSETKAIKPGAMRRMELIQQAFENNTRINPSIEGFDSINKLIAQTNYDMTAIEQYATFSKYNTQIQEQKLFKDPALEKLNWNMTDKKFRFRVLKTFDPYHFQVGVDTRCCQKLGGVGEAAAIDSYINPLAGVVVLEAVINGDYTLISQSYFHYVPQTNGVILDNVEHTNLDDKLKESTGYDIDQLYAWWAKTKKDANKYDYFLCGTSYNKLDNDKFGRKKLNKDPRSFKYDDQYTDWKPSSSVDLLEPKFEVPETKAKKTKKRKEALFHIQQLLRMAA